MSHRPLQLKLHARDCLGHWAFFIVVSFIFSGVLPTLAFQDKEQKRADTSSQISGNASIHIDFVRDIQPIFNARCVQCHNSKNPMEGLRLDSNQALQGGQSGKSIIPGEGAESLLVKMIAGQVDVFGTGCWF